MYSGGFRPKPCAHPAIVYAGLDAAGRRLKYPFAPVIETPKGLSDMRAAAAFLAEPFVFARVDFYQADQVYFGEITFAPEGDYECFDPPELDVTLGSMIDLRRVLVDLANFPTWR